MSKVNKIANVQPFILAVSGGVDSVVLLDMMAQTYSNLVIAHFEHGIRGAESVADARFVRDLAKKYNLPYEIATGALGINASEDQARQARYKFLRQVAKERKGLLCTAHHADDVIESIAINLSRGTGWRGLAVMGATDIYRPLLNTTKEEVVQYAKSRDLKWREDSSNKQLTYLRNRLRLKLKELPLSYKEMLFDLFKAQTTLKFAIEKRLEKTVNQSGKYKRYQLIMSDEKVACEILQFIIKHHTGVSLLYNQVERALLAIKVARVGEIHQLAQGAYLKFSTSFFVVKNS